VPWNWRDSRHAVERAADERYGRIRRGEEITEAVAGLTDRVIAERVRLEKGYEVVAEGTSVAVNGSGVVRRPEIEVLPPIQIKGLAADVLMVKRGFSEIREVVRDVNLVSAALKQDLADVKAQLQSHRQDIRFEAEALGNGGEG
jgi:hypothetical protein